MPTAYYMTFALGHDDSLDRIGGLPTHLPSEYPVSQLTGKPLGFVSQFACHPERLPVKGFLVQVYMPVESDDTEMLRAIVLADNSRPNTTGQGRELPRVVPHSINWEAAEDPAEPLSDEQAMEGNLFRSKAGGACPIFDVCQPDETYLLQLNQQPGNFNFGGYNCVLIKRADDSIYATFA